MSLVEVSCPEEHRSRCTVCDDPWASVGATATASPACRGRRPEELRSRVPLWPCEDRRPAGRIRRFLPARVLLATAIRRTGGRAVPEAERMPGHTCACGSMTSGRRFPEALSGRGDASHAWGKTCPTGLCAVESKGPSRCGPVIACVRWSRSEPRGSDSSDRISSALDRLTRSSSPRQIGKRAGPDAVRMGAPHSIGDSAAERDSAGFVFIRIAARQPRSGERDDACNARPSGLRSGNDNHRLAF